MLASSRVILSLQRGTNVANIEVLEVIMRHHKSTYFFYKCWFDLVITTTSAQLRYYQDLLLLKTTLTAAFTPSFPACCAWCQIMSNLTLSFAVCLPCLTGATHSSLRQLHSFPLTWPAVDTRSENYAETPVTLCQAICARHSSVHETPDKWQSRLTWDDPRWCRVAQMAWCWSTGMKASGRSHVILRFSSLIVHSCERKCWV